jgi:plasmid replication initiation protein
MISLDTSCSVDQLDLFSVPELAPGWRPMKDDIYSMELPIFSLSKTKDVRERTYQRGGRYVKIIPSIIGAATIFDKDIVLYGMSQIARAIEAGLPHSRRVKFTVRPFLISTCRSTGSDSYDRIVEACKRLRGTTIVTNIKTTESESTLGFGLIEHFQVTRFGKNKSPLEIEITLSDWLYRLVVGLNILTIHPHYYQLTQPLKRRLYEIARKHCGDKAHWKIGVDLLQEKIGCERDKKYFRRDLKTAIGAGDIPEYRIYYDASTNHVFFFSANTKRLSAALVDNKALMATYQRLIQGALKGTQPAH